MIPVYNSTGDLIGVEINQTKYSPEIVLMVASRLERAEGEREQARAERDTLHTQLETALRRVEELRDALHEFGDHDPACLCLRDVEPQHECSCGYREAYDGTGYTPKPTPYALVALGRAAVEVEEAREARAAAYSLPVILRGPGAVECTQAREQAMNDGDARVGRAEAAYRAAVAALRALDGKE